MRISVIGKTGQLSRRLAIAGKGRQILFHGRDTLDLERPETIAPTLEQARPDVIINAAAYTQVDKAEEERERAFAVNANGAGEAARVAEALGAAFLHVSTDYVFDGLKTGAYVETDPTGPQGTYGASKLAGEQAVRAACPRSAVFRTAWVYAPDGRNFLTTMLRVGAEHDVLRVVEDQHGSPTSAAELADFLLLAAEHCTDGGAEAPVFECFHVSGYGATSWAGFAEAIFEIAVAEGILPRAPQIERILTSDYPTPAKRPKNSVLDCTKAKHVFRASLEPWREGLQRAMREIPTSR